ncbi:MAG: hypothetical protein GC149_16235 [Gammaproteobacteria bacterium]|nr:hypothetical protein [Gammaproteobacteria bacterium]
MWRRIIMFIGSLSLLGCSTYPPITTATQVDIKRFMGDWYVIANIPTFIETGAHNAVESYKLNRDGTVATTFTFRQNGFEGEQKTYHPTGYITDTKSNAVWGMQFIWPFKADYRIVYVSNDYTQTIIGRLKRDYVWIMARSPAISESDYQKLLQLIKDQGYDLSKVRKVPQRWQ